MCICSYCWLFSSTSCVKSEKPVHTFTPSEGSKTPERNKFKLETTDKGKYKLLGRGSIGIFSLLLLIYKGKLAKWTVLKGKGGVDVLGELRNISTTCFLPCGICMQQARKCHNMNSFWSSICCWHVLWCWKCHVPQLWFERLVVSKFLRLPWLGEWWQYEYRKTLTIILECHFTPRFPAGITPLSLCCASASFYIPITVLQFFSSFSRCSLRCRRSASWWATWAWKLSEQERYSTGPQTASICFSPVEVPRCILPVFVHPGGNCGH